MQSNENSNELAKYVHTHVLTKGFAAAPNMGKIFTELLGEYVIVDRTSFGAWLDNTGRLHTVLSCVTKTGEVIGQADIVHTVADYFEEMPSKLKAFDIAHFIYDHIEAPTPYMEISNKVRDHVINVKRQYSFK